MGLLLRGDATYTAIVNQLANEKAIDRLQKTTDRLHKDRSGAGWEARRLEGQSIKEDGDLHCFALQLHTAATWEVKDEGLLLSYLIQFIDTKKALSLCGSGVLYILLGVWGVRRLIK